VRAISPGVPPSPNSRPINVPIFEASTNDLVFTKEELPDFFKFGKHDSGLISYERFLVIVTLLALPAAEVPVAYRMCAGEEFNNKKFRGTDLNVHNFDFIMQRNIKIRGQGYTTDHEPGDLVHYLFGDDLKRTLSFQEFRDFHLALRDEVERLQYYLLSDKLDAEGNAMMSLPAFARSVAALVPSDYRNEFLEKALRLGDHPLPEKVVREAIKKGRIDPKRAQGGEVFARDINVSLTEYINWQEVLRSLVQMEDAVKRYSYADGHFSRTNLNRAALAVAGVKLAKSQVFVLFTLFDRNETDKLYHDDFVRLLQPHTVSTDPRSEQDGLGLGSLMSCVTTSCKLCVRNWYEGTKE